MKESLFLLTLLHDEKLTYHLLLLVCSFGMGATGNVARDADGQR